MKPVAVLQNCEVERAGTIIDYLNDRSIPFSEIHSYKNENLPEIDGIGAIISLGSPISFTQFRSHDFLIELYEYTKQAVAHEKPFLGFCFGAQVLAAALGGTVRPNHVKEIGNCEISLTEKGKTDSIFKGFTDEFPVYQWHSDTFELPEDVENLATSDNCRNQAFRKGKLVGVQFHIEADDRQVAIWCDTYAWELAAENRSKKIILNELRNNLSQIRNISDQLLDNFFSL